MTLILSNSSMESVADLRGRKGRALPGSKFFRFHAVFGKIWQKCVLAPPPGELASPSRGNPGSSTGNDTCHFENFA